MAGAGRARLLPKAQRPERLKREQVKVKVMRCSYEQLYYRHHSHTRTRAHAHYLCIPFPPPNPVQFFIFIRRIALLSLQLLCNLSFIDIKIHILTHTLKILNAAAAATVAVGFSRAARSTALHCSVQCAVCTGHWALGIGHAPYAVLRAPCSVRRAACYRSTCITFCEAWMKASGCSSACPNWSIWCL